MRLGEKTDRFEIMRFEANASLVALVVFVI